MRPHPIQRRPTAATVLGALAAVAAAGAIAAFAAREQDAAAAAEGLYLARLAAVVLLATAALAPPPAREVALGAGLAVATAWALPGGPTRGAAEMLVLVGCLAVAAARRLVGPRAVGRAGELDLAGAQDGPAAARPGEGEATAFRSGAGAIARSGEGAKLDGQPGRRWPAGADLTAAIALCLGAQALLRGDLLFAPGQALRPWALLVGLPVVAGAALALLRCRYGTAPALAAATGAAVLAPGWTVGTTLALLALAGGSELAAAFGAANRAPQGWRPGLVRLRLALAGLAMLAPVAWEPRSGWVATVAAVALVRPGVALGLGAALGAICRFAPLPGALAAHAGWHEGTLGIAWLAMLVPAALLAAARRQGDRKKDGREDRTENHRGDGQGGRRWILATAAALACGAPWLPDRAALAPAVALAALALPPIDIEAGIAGAWSAAVALGTALLASYPWLRRDPVASALGLLGAAPGWRLAAAIAAAAGALAAVGALAGQRAAGAARAGQGRRAAAGSTPASMAPEGGTAAGGTQPSMAAAARMAVGGTPASMEATGGTQEDGTPAAGTAASMAPAAGTAVGRTATGMAAAGVAAAVVIAVVGPLVWRPERGLITPGGTVLLERARPEWVSEMGAGRVGAVVVQSSLQNAAGLADGTPVARLRLQSTGDPDVEVVIRAGQDSGEWSARRADVAAAARLHSPAAWVSWVAGDFFGQSYRTRLALPHAGSFARLRVELVPGLPAAVGLALYQVEVEP